MRVLAVSRFRQLTLLRAGTPLFVLAFLPPAGAAMIVGISEPALRDHAESILPMLAWAGMSSWILHALLLGFATLTSGKVRSAHDFVVTEGTPDLMDTAPVGEGTRFWGETFGTFGAALQIHFCCLPLLAAVAVLSPLPASFFLSIEGVMLPLLFLAGAGAAWQRRAPRTKYAGTRGPRNVFVVALAGLAAIAVTTRAREFRDAALEFIYPRASMRGWRQLADTVESPTLLIALLALLYAGTILYYYRSATRKRVWEN